MISVIGCVSTPVNDYCLIAKEIHTTSQDVELISAELIDSLYEHNMTYLKLCE